MMMSGPDLVSIADAMRGFRSFMLIKSTVSSTPASLPNSAVRRLNSTSEAGTKLTHSRMLSLVAFGKLGGVWAATNSGVPAAGAGAGARRGHRRGARAAGPAARQCEERSTIHGSEGFVRHRFLLFHRVVAVRDRWRDDTTRGHRCQESDIKCERRRRAPSAAGKRAS